MIMDFPINTKHILMLAACIVAVFLSVLGAGYSYLFALVTFIGIFSTIIIFAKPECGLYLVAVFIPIGKYTLPGIPFNVTASDVLIIITLLSWLIRKIVYEKKYKSANDKLFIFLVIFCVLSTLALFNCKNKARGSIELIQTFEYFIVIPYLFLDLIKNPKQIRIILWIMVFGAFVYSPLGILEAVRGIRATSIAGHANAFGAYLAMLIPIVYCLFLNEKKSAKKIILITAMILSALAFMGTLSRGSWLALFAALLVFSVKSGVKKSFFIGITLVIIVFGLVSFLMPGMVTERIKTMTEMKVDTTGERLSQVDNAIDMIKMHPFLGVGMNEAVRYNEVVDTKGGPKIHAEMHNVYLAIASERGLIALFFFLAFVFLYLTRLWHVCTFSNIYGVYFIIFFSASVSFLIGSLFHNSVGRGNGNFFMMIVGMALALQNLSKGENAKG
jgi:O-antigen ligase